MNNKKRYKDIDWEKFEQLGLSLLNKTYKFGAEINIYDPNPDHIEAIDCSELTEWLFYQIGLKLPDGSYNQIKHTVPILRDNIRIGDLGFKWWPETEVVHHVGVYIGEGRVLEAKGKSYGTILTPIREYEDTDHFAGWFRHKDIYV